MIPPRKEMWEFDQEYQVVKKKNSAVDFIGIPNLFIHKDGGDREIIRTLLEEGQLELEDIPAEGYTFSGWDVRSPLDPPFDFENDEVDSENPPIVISLEGPLIITAYFEAVRGLIFPVRLR